LRQSLSFIESDCGPHNVFEKEIGVACQDKVMRLTFFARSIGLGTILLSVLGLLICVAGIVGVSMVKSRVEAIGTAVFSAADDSLVFVDAKIDRVKQAVDNTRQRVGGISKLVERLRDEKADARKEAEPLLQALDEVFQQLKAAESWLDSCQAVASGVSRVSEAVISSKYAASHEDSARVAVARDLQQFSESITEVLAKLQAVRQELIQLRDTGKLAREVVARVIARVVDLDGRLTAISARLEKFDARVEQTRASCVHVKLKVHWWISIAAAALTILLVWFAISQVSMTTHGWRLMQGKRATETAR
jgi:predicted  nucleic acid-binding Zn-ribbon protein